MIQNYFSIYGAALTAQSYRVINIETQSSDTEGSSRLGINTHNIHTGKNDKTILVLVIKIRGLKEVNLSTSVLRRQRSQVRILSGAPLKKGLSIVCLALF